MPTEEPTMSHEQPQAVEDHDAWLDDFEELPRRPRRHLLGTGGNPVFLALLAVLLIACGFIGGVLVEKGETSSSSSTGSSGSAASLASRFRALREGASSGTGTGSSSAGAAPSSAGGFVRPTAGTVAYLEGSTLYVTDSEGNTVRVTTSKGTSVTKTVKSNVGAVHPGETVTVTGETSSNGTVSAEAISVGSNGGGLAALFGGGRGTGAAGSSKEPALFGNG